MRNRNLHDESNPCIRTIGVSFERFEGDFITTLVGMEVSLIELGHSTLTNCMAFNISKAAGSEIPSIEGRIGLLLEDNGIDTCLRCNEDTNSYGANEDLAA